MKNKFLLLFVILFTIMQMVSGDGPDVGIPNFFTGSVTVNGNPAPDGLLISAKIDGNDVATTITRSGYYGRDPYIFFIPDPNNDREGKTIVFLVDGVEAAQVIFHNAHHDDLPLSITTSGNQGTSGSTSSGGGGNNGGSSSGSSQKSVVEQGTQSKEKTFEELNVDSGDSKKEPEIKIVDSENKNFISRITGAVTGTLGPTGIFVVVAFLIGIVGASVITRIVRKRKNI